MFDPRAVHFVDAVPEDAGERLAIQIPFTSRQSGHGSVAEFTPNAFMVAISDSDAKFETIDGKKYLGFTLGINKQTTRNIGAEGRQKIANCAAQAMHPPCVAPVRAEWMV